MKLILLMLLTLPFCGCLYSAGIDSAEKTNATSSRGPSFPTAVIGSTAMKSAGHSGVVEVGSFSSVRLRGGKFEMTTGLSQELPQ